MSQEPAPSPPNAPLRTPQILDTGVNYVVIWQMARKYWPLVLATTVLVTAGATFYTLGEPKIYSASATLMLDPHPPRPLGANVETVVEMGAGNYWDVRDYYETQYKILQSRRVAKAVVQELGLDKDGSFLMNLPKGKQPDKPVVADEDAAASTLMGREKVEPIKDSRLATVKLEDADPERAQRVLNVLLDVYIAQNLEDARSTTSNAADWLRGQVDNLKNELEKSELSLHDYKSKNNILSVQFDDQSNMLREEMRQINEVLTTVRTKREEIAARKAELEKVQADPSKLPASELLTSPLLQSLRTRYEESVRERDALVGAGKGENHPDVLAATARVDASKAALLQEVRNIQGSVAADLSIISRQEGGLAGLLNGAKKQALDLNLLEIEYNRLQRSKQNTEKLYSVVLERSKESDLALMLRENNIRVVDRPLAPSVPIRPQVTLNLTLGAVGGAALGVVLALIRGLLDRSLKVPEDIETSTGLTCLGLLPQVENKGKTKERGRRRRRVAGGEAAARELAVHFDPLGPSAEATRAIRTNLMFMAPDKPFRTMLVTSAAPSDGKTTVATFLAIVMAQAGQRVALVDCDLRKPRVHRVFKKSSAVGVTTALLDGDLDAAIHQTEVPNLWVIPAGPIAPNPAELFHSEKFRALLADISSRFDRVIIDSSPLIAVTDAAILSTLVDTCVIVARAFVTTKDVFRHAVRSLYDIGTKPAGAVLNAVDFDRHEYKYAYYYYYRREGYYGESEGSGSSSQLPPPAGEQPPATH